MPLVAIVAWGTFAAPRARRRLATGVRVPFELSVFALAALALLSASWLARDRVRVGGCRQRRLPDRAWPMGRLANSRPETGGIAPAAWQERDAQHLLRPAIFAAYDAWPPPAPQDAGAASMKP